MKLRVTLSCFTLLLAATLLCTRICAQNMNPANYDVLGHDFFFGMDDWHHIDIALDNSNKPWVITQAMEPNCLCNYISNYDGSDWHVTGAPGSIVMHSLHVDENGLKWIGTSDGIYSYDGTNWVHYNSANSGLTKNDVYCVKTDHVGKVWILSSENNEIYVTLWSGNSWQVFSPSETNIDYYAPGEFKLDNLNNFYFNDYYHVVKYDGASWSVINSSLATRGFDVDAGNNLWYTDDASSDHLVLGEWVNGAWTTTNLSNTENHEAPVWSLVADDLGRKWMIELNEIWIYDGTDCYYLQRPGDCAYSFIVRVGSDGSAWGVGTDGFGHCDVYQFFTSAVSTQDLSDANGIEIFPTPATDVLKLRSNSLKPISLDVKDVFGRTVYSTDLINSLSVDISQWSSGMYFIYTNNQSRDQVLRFLKQ